MILALEARTSTHIGRDNLNVVGHVGRLQEGLYEHGPCPLIKDADVLLSNKDMMSKRSQNTLRITKVKGHAVAEMVRLGAFQQVDNGSNHGADETADLSRTPVGGFHKLVIFATLLFMTCTGLVKGLRLEKSVPK